MNLTMSMFATHEDYWKARSRLNESIVADVAKELGCERDNEAIIEALAKLKEEAAMGRAVQRPDFWELRKSRKVAKYGDMHPLTGVMAALEWEDVYQAGRSDGNGKIEWESGNTAKEALRAAGLMEGDE